MDTKTDLATGTAKPKARLRQWITNHWHPAPMEPPKVDPELPILNDVQRSAEVLRYSVLKTEYWLSPSGTLREWVRLNAIVALILSIPALFIVPLVTWLLAEFVTWSELLVQIAKNLAVFPVLAVLGAAFITGILFAARLFLRILLHK